MQVLGRDEEQERDRLWLAELQSSRLIWSEVAITPRSRRAELEDGGEKGDLGVGSNTLTLALIIITITISRDRER